MTRNEFVQRLGMSCDASGPPGGSVVVEERDPAKFMTDFARAAASGCDVFLADPGWGTAERAQLAELLRAAGDRDATRASADRGWLMIPSGGTSGQLKFARHDQETLAAAVGGFRQHFDLAKVNAVGVLPLHHVSGLMAWLRAALTGGTYLPLEWKTLEQGSAPGTPAAEPWVISLVPTQLQRLLGRRAALEWLRRFAVIFLGGGPAWPDLLDRAAGAGLRLALSYGMTETAAMVTALRPAEFLAGARSCGAALPHARVDLAADGVVRVGGASLFRGYYPAWTDAPRFTTEDLGEFDARGHLVVHGRRDAVIITGGKKVHPAEVEAALLASGEFGEVAVVGVPDPEWGQLVVACHPAGARNPDVARAAAALSPHQRPKRYVAVEHWPRNAQGKLNRAALFALARA